MARRFSRFAAHAADWTGRFPAFMAALGIVLLWALSGPLFGFSQTWQLVINTGTTIVTFLMVFVIQNSQNRDAIAVHLKLDEIIRAIETANNRIIDAEERDDEQLDALKNRYQAMSTD
jgi:low affinity Fe/Cu permease